MNLRDFVAAVTLTLIAPVPAAATAIALHFTGTVDEVNDDHGISDGSVTVGTPFAGSVTFDDSAPDTMPDPQRGLYEFDTPAWTFTAQVGSYTFFSVAPVMGDPSYAILIRNDDPYDRMTLATAFVAGSVVGPLAEPNWLGTLSLSFLDAAASALSSDALTSAPFDVSLWPENAFSFAVSAPGQFYGLGEIDTLTAVVVPEPGSFGLVAMGTLWFAARLRRR